MKRALSLLLALCMLASIGSPAAWANDPSPSPEAETEAVLRLPTSLKTIEEEAFFGDTSLGEVVLPEGIESIGKDAFAESSLKKINLPNSLKSIDDTALPPPGTVIVTANEGSTAYNWAEGKKYIVAPVAIDETNFPDANFRDYVAKYFDTDKDGTLSEDEIAAVTEIYLNGQDITDLKGIEHFTALRYLYCFNNQLATLNVSGCRALTVLQCSVNQLASLDVSTNTAMRYLVCSNNQLKTLDVSGNTALSILICYGNQLTALNLSANTALMRMYCSNNQLTALNLTGCTALNYLSCAENALTSLALGDSSQLIALDCSQNALETLDVSANAALEQLRCEDNPLTTLDVSACPNLVVAVEQGEESVNEAQNLRVFDYDAALGYFQLSLPANADLILTPPSANVA